jgi:hypothetical protein
MYQDFRNAVKTIYFVYVPKFFFTKIITEGQITNNASVLFLKLLVRVKFKISIKNFWQIFCEDSGPNFAIFRAKRHKKQKFYSKKI